MIVPFPGALTAQLNKVGGKGQSLIRMTQLGLPVPPGFVLTVDFFAEWLDQIKLSDEWKKFTSADPSALKQCCDALKEKTRELTFSKPQAKEIKQALTSFDEESLFAVRSSSPAEDLDGSSFAGGYETVLGVKRNGMLEAVRQAFASSLDFRVLAYKHQHGFDIFDPRIAVVVQKQINSSASGVAFSINPLTNDYDEAVFNANFGLGESVVSGICTPDTIVVDKVSMRIREKTAGAKEERIMLNAKGGTTTLKGDMADEFAISDGHVLSLTRYIKTLEEVFRKPVDVEWALDGDDEYILQARPVTSYVPLPPSMITRAGQPRRLYADLTLSVQALEKPMSVMGTSLVRKLLSEFPKQLLGISVVRDIDHSLVYLSAGRIYAVLSHAIHLFGKENVCRFLKIMDPIAAQAVMELDEELYEDHQLWVHLLPLKVAPGLVRLLPKIANIRAFPEKTHIQVQKKMAAFRDQIRKDAQAKGSIDQVAARIVNRTADMLGQVTMPAFLGARITLERIKHTAEGVDPQILQNLELAMPHNVTIEMGLALYDLAQQLPPNADPDTDIQDQTLSPEFMATWQSFLNQYGHRGPRELDIQAPRYRDKAALLFEQVTTLNKSSTDSNNPLLRYQKNKKLRDDAYNTICEYLAKKDLKRLKRFKFLYRTWETFGGYRETHKYYMIYAMDALRTRVIAEAEKLVSQKRLDTVERVFDLTIEDFEKNVPNKKVDLLELAEQNRKDADRLAQVPQLPPLIDSRGRILRSIARPATSDGDVVGTPISTGVARGPAKTLLSADEKTLNYGDILVARATDPGWTPLFVNASAVVLEVGGLLQHGALVAREYGLPCVGGVTGATTLWKDGTILEVDGTQGIIRVVE